MSKMDLIRAYADAIREQCRTSDEQRAAESALYKAKAAAVSARGVANSYMCVLRDQYGLPIADIHKIDHSATESYRERKANPELAKAADDNTVRRHLTPEQRDVLVESLEKSANGVVVKCDETFTAVAVHGKEYGIPE